MGCHFLLQGIFPTQGLNLGLLKELVNFFYEGQGSKYLRLCCSYLTLLLWLEAATEGTSEWEGLCPSKTLFTKTSIDPTHLWPEIWWPVLHISTSYSLYVVCLVAQSCPTLCDPMDCSPPGHSIHGDSPSKNTEVNCHFLLQGIFLTQVLSLHLLHWQVDFFTTEPPGKPLAGTIPSLNLCRVLDKKQNQRKHASLS